MGAAEDEVRMRIAGVWLALMALSGCTSADDERAAETARRRETEARAERSAGPLTGRFGVWTRDGPLQGAQGGLSVLVTETSDGAYLLALTDRRRVRVEVPVREDRSGAERYFEGTTVIACGASGTTDLAGLDVPVRAPHGSLEEPMRHVRVAGSVRLHLTLPVPAPRPAPTTRYTQGDDGIRGVYVLHVTDAAGVEHEVDLERLPGPALAARR